MTRLFAFVFQISIVIYGGECLNEIDSSQKLNEGTVNWSAVQNTSETDLQNAIKQYQDTISVGLLSNKSSLIGYPLEFCGITFSVLSKTDINQPIRIALKLLNVIYGWYKLKIAQNDNADKYIQIQKASHTSTLYKFIAHYLLSNKTNSIDIDIIQTIYELLKIQFPNDKYFMFFYKHCYYNPFLKYVRDGTLIFIDKIGYGASSIVLKVQNTKNSEYYALKIFNKKHSYYCKTEANVMYRAHNEIKSDIKIPSIIDCYCHDVGWILMEFIDGITLEQNTNLTWFQATSLLDEISNTIIELGNIGIGHFDLNPSNILMDCYGSFWLIDFGMAVDVPSLTHSYAGGIRHYDLNIPHPIIGTLAFYAPHTVIIDGLTDIDGVVVHGKQILIDLIIDANLFSLNAVTMYSLLSRSDPIREKISSDWTKLHQLFRENYASEITDEMMEIIQGIWTLFRFKCVDYLQDSNHVNDDMFGLLLEGDSAYDNMQVQVIQSTTSDYAHIRSMFCQSKIIDEFECQRHEDRKHTFNQENRRNCTLCAVM